MKKTPIFILSFLTLSLFHSLFSGNEDDFTLQTIDNYQITQNTPSTTQTFNDLVINANNLFHRSNFEEAITFYQKALDLNPQSAPVFFNMGQAFFELKKYPEALQAYKNALMLNPKHDHALIQIGKLLHDVKQYKDAIFPLQKGLSLNPNHIEARLLLARIFHNDRQFAESIDTIKQGLALFPSNINLRFELANIYNTINKLEKALAIYEQLNKEMPNNPSINYNIAFTLKKLDRIEESLVYYDKALELNPQHSDAIFSRGLAYLMLGDFEKGWEGYEWRYNRPEYGSLRTFKKPRWDGSDLTNKTILIHAEQGLGDTLQFIRCAIIIKQKNAKIIAMVQKPLVALLKNCPFLDQVISMEDQIPYHDVQAPIMSLPYILKIRLDSIPCEVPYIFADKELKKHWKKELSHDKNFKIGICWQGNDNYATPMLRTTVALKSTTPDQFAPICNIPGISLYSLQKISGTDLLKNLPENVRIITFEGDFDQSHGRFMDTAAVIGELDLMLTVDTSLGHLAAAIGIPTWIMLPNPADWRWMTKRTDTPWYPNVRLFKQPTPGDWTGMINEIAQELTIYMQEHTS